MKFRTLAGGLGISAISVTAVLVVPGSSATASLQQTNVVQDGPNRVAKKYLDQKVNWQICGDPELKTSCARIVVPRDWSDQARGVDIQLAISKAGAAKKPSRVVFGNPGGPGGAGLGMAPYLASQTSTRQGPPRRRLRPARHRRQRERHLRRRTRLHDGRPRPPPVEPRPHRRGLAAHPPVLRGAVARAAPLRQHRPDRAGHGPHPAAARLRQDRLRRLLRRHLDGRVLPDLLPQPRRPIRPRLEHGLHRALAEHVHRPAAGLRAPVPRGLRSLGREVRRPAETRRIATLGDQNLRAAPGGAGEGAGDRGLPGRVGANQLRPEHARQYRHRGFVYKGGFPFTRPRSGIPARPFRRPAQRRRPGGPAQGRPAPDGASARPRPARDPAYRRHHTLRATLRRRRRERDLHGRHVQRHRVAARPRVRRRARRATRPEVPAARLVDEREPVRVLGPPEPANAHSHRQRLADNADGPVGARPGNQLPPSPHPPTAGTPGRGCSRSPTRATTASTAA